MLAYDGTRSLLLNTKLDEGQNNPEVPSEVTSPNGLKQYYPLDINGHWGYNSIKDFLYVKMLKGYQNTDGSYRNKPNKPITRAEFAAILTRVHSTLTRWNPEKQFSDVKTSDW